MDVEAQPPVPAPPARTPLEAAAAALADEQAALAAVFPRYRALLQARARSASPAPGATATTAPAPPVAAPAGPASLRSVLGGSHATKAGGALRATFPEMMRGDPVLFRLPLLSGQTWDSMRAITAGAGAGAGGGIGAPRVEPFVSRLVNYSHDGAPGSNNTLVLRGVYTPLADERAFVAVSIGSVPRGGGVDPLAALASDVLMHVSFRIDPPGGAAAASGALRYRYTQCFKAHGRWDTASAAQPYMGPGTWPFSTDVPFWLRLTITPRGCFSYVNGRAMAFTRHAGGGAWVPGEDPNLHLLLPVAGDASEKATWRVLEAWWGSCAVDDAGEALAATVLARAPGAGGVVVAPGELYVTGLPRGATAADICAAFARWGPVACAEPNGAPAIVVRLPEGTLPPAVARAIAESNRIVSVCGAVVNVTAALTQRG